MHFPGERMALLVLHDTSVVKQLQLIVRYDLPQKARRVSHYRRFPKSAPGRGRLASSKRAKGATQNCLCDLRWPLRLCPLSDTLRLNFVPKPRRIHSE